MDFIRRYRNEKVIKGFTVCLSVEKINAVDGDTYYNLILPEVIPQKFLDAVAECMLHMLDDKIKRSTRIVMPEEDIPVFSEFCRNVSLPVSPIYTDDRSLPDQICIYPYNVHKGSDAPRYCAPLNAGEEVIIMRRLMSSGRTEVNISDALKRNGCHPSCVASIYVIGKGIQLVHHDVGHGELGYARIEVADNGLEVVKFHRNNSGRLYI
ncbi:MAG: hypothetical protein V1900_01900 [Candidatus Aenigmatarchaeota archaeon]